MRRLIRLGVLWALLGAAYMLIEITFKLLISGGRIHLAMLPVGGLCGLAVGSINQVPRFFHMRIIWQCLIGTALTLAIELVAGLILNVWLVLGIWDYSGIPGNIAGQICLPFAAAWFALMPFAIWLEDTLRWGFGWDGRAYSLGSIYRELGGDFAWIGQGVWRATHGA